MMVRHLRNGAQFDFIDKAAARNMLERFFAHCAKAAADGQIKDAVDLGFIVLLLERTVSEFCENPDDAKAGFQEAGIGDWVVDDAIFGVLGAHLREIPRQLQVLPRRREPAGE